jgi:hypothetical protein
MGPHMLSVITVKLPFIYIQFHPYRPRIPCSFLRIRKIAGTIYEYRCDERLKAKAEESTRLAETGLKIANLSYQVRAIFFPSSRFCAVRAQMGRKKDGWRTLLAVLMILLLQPLMRTRLGMCVQNIDVLVSTVKRVGSSNFQLSPALAHRHTQYSPTYMIMPMCVCLCLCFVSVSRSRRSGDRRRTAGEKFWKSLNIHFILGMLAQLTLRKAAAAIVPSRRYTEKV